MATIEMLPPDVAIDPDEDRFLVGQSFSYFMTQHWLVADKRRNRERPYTHFQTAGPFKFLQPILYAWQHCPHDIITDKSRQGGVSTIAAGRCGWMGITEEDREAEIMGKDKKSSAKLASKIGYAMRKIERYAPHLFETGKFPKAQTERVLFPETGSVIDINPHTPDSGRGDTTDLFCLDEWAFMEWARENWYAIAPTTDWGGQLIGISTPKYGTLYNEQVDGASKVVGGEPMPRKPRGWHPDSGRDLTQHIAAWALWLDWFCRRIGWDWEKQRSIFEVDGNTDKIPWPVGENGFMLIRLHWSYNELRREEWVDRIWRKVKKNRILFMQEYELDATQAQLLVFDHDNAQAIYLPPDEARRQGVPLGLQAIRWGEDYVLAADLAEGVEGGDKTIVKLLHADTGLVLQTWEIGMDIEYTAALMYQVYQQIIGAGGNIIVAPDCSGFHGGSFLATVRYLYPEMLNAFYQMEDPVVDLGKRPSYVRRGRGRAGGTPPKLGFMFTKSSKPQVIDELVRAVNNGLVTETDAETITEICQYEHKGNRKMGAPEGPGYFDDRVCCLAIAHWVRRQRAIQRLDVITPARRQYDESPLLIAERRIEQVGRGGPGLYAPLRRDFGGW